MFRRFIFTTNPKPRDIPSCQKFDQLCGLTVTLPASDTACEFFELTFLEDLIDQIVAQSNIYAISNPPSSEYREWQDVTSEMVSSFLW